MKIITLSAVYISWSDVISTNAHIQRCDYLQDYLQEYWSELKFTIYAECDGIAVCFVFVIIQTRTSTSIFWCQSGEMEASRTCSAY